MPKRIFKEENRLKCAGCGHDTFTKEAYRTKLPGKVIVVKTMKCKKCGLEQVIEERHFYGIRLKRIKEDCHEEAPEVPED